MPVQIIYDSEHVRVMFRPGTSRYALITFSPPTLLADRDHFWGRQIADTGDLTAIGVMTLRANWYPAQDMRKVAEIVAPLLAGFDQVLTHGASMGGYGGLKYGKLLGATHCLAFAPQWSIAPADVAAWDTRFLTDYEARLHPGMRITTEDCIPRPIVFYDPFFEPDRLNVDRIVADCSSAETVRVYLTGHFPESLYEDPARALELFDMCLAGDIGGIRRRSTELRRDPSLGLRVKTVAEGFMKTDMPAALRMLEQYPEIYDVKERGAFHHQMAKVHLNRGELDDAARCSAAAVADVSTVRDFHIRRSTIEGQRGNLADALAIAQETVARWPNDAQSHVCVAEAQVLRGDAAAAEAALSRAFELDPRWSPAIRSMVRSTRARSDDAAERLWLRRLVELWPDSGSYQRIAELLTQIKRHDQASEAMQKAVALTPTSARLWLLLAESLRLEGRQIKSAEAAVESVKLDPTNLRSQRLAWWGYEQMGLPEYGAPYRKVAQELEAARPRPAVVEEEEPAPKRSWWSMLWSRRAPHPPEPLPR